MHPQFGKLICGEIHVDKTGKIVDIDYFQTRRLITIVEIRDGVTITRHIMDQDYEKTTIN